MRVCVVGAGAAGLCSAYHLAKAHIDYVMFEKTALPGGTWNYSDEVNVHSSMYRDLVTNLPVEIMGYAGHPFPDVGKSFAHRSVVLDYLNEFFNEHIRPMGKTVFNAEVLKISQNASGWTVNVVLNGTESRTEEFSHVMVCNGKYSVPRVLQLNGLETFSGQIEHSHNYRHAEKYRQKTVLVIGAGFSGIDIALEVVAVSKKCILNHRKKDHLQLPENIRQVNSPVSRINGQQVIFEDGTTETIDVILFCTGYRISFPFLDGIVSVRDGYEVEDLYRHCLSIKHPTLAIIGLPSRIVPCFVHDYQVQFAIEVFTQELPLPSITSMRQAVEQDRQSRIKSGKGELKFAHDMGDGRMWDYIDQFVKDGFKKPDPAVRIGYEAANLYRIADPVNYKTRRVQF